MSRRESVNLIDMKSNLKFLQEELSLDDVLYNDALKLYKRFKKKDINRGFDSRITACTLIHLAGRKKKEFIPMRNLSDTFGISNNSIWKCYRNIINKAPGFMRSIEPLTNVDYFAAVVKNVSFVNGYKEKLEDRVMSNISFLESGNNLDGYSVPTAIGSVTYLTQKYEEIKYDGTHYMKEMSIADSLGITDTSIRKCNQKVVPVLNEFYK